MAIGDLTACRYCGRYTVSQCLCYESQRGFAQGIVADVVKEMVGIDALLTLAGVPVYTGEAVTLTVRQRVELLIEERNELSRKVGAVL